MLLCYACSRVHLRLSPSSLSPSLSVSPLSSAWIPACFDLIQVNYRIDCTTWLSRVGGRRILSSQSRSQNKEGGRENEEGYSCLRRETRRTGIVLLLLLLLLLLLMWMTGTGVASRFTHSPSLSPRVL